MVDKSENDFLGLSVTVVGVSTGGSNPGSKKASLIGSRIAHKFKVILLGNVSVGKTCLMHKFVENKELKVYQSSISCEVKKKMFPLDQRTVVDLDIVDTCGEERFRAMTKSYYRTSQGIILMFDISDELSFISLPQWLSDIQSNAEKNVRIILAGNKADSLGFLKRQVSRTRAEDFAKQEKLLYLEISAMTGFNVDLLFEKLAHQIIEIQNLTIEKEEKKIEQDIRLKKIAINNIKEGKREEGCC